MSIITEDFRLSGSFSSVGFGDDLAFSGDGGLLAVAAPRHNFPDAAGAAQGAVYLVDMADPLAAPAVLQPTEIQQDRFGQSVALNAAGTLLLVGAPGDDDGRDPDPGSGDTSYTESTGSVYIYDLSGAVPVLAAEIQAGDSIERFDQFGWTVALSASGNRALISSTVRGDGTPPPGQIGPDAGDVLVYDFSGTTPVFRFALTPDTPAPYPYSQSTGFGLASAVSADGNWAIVGAPSEEVRPWPDLFPLEGLGAAYVYDLSGPTPVQTGRLTQADAGVLADFGRNVTISGDGTVAAVSADQVTPFVSDVTSGGLVYVYDLTGGVPSLRFSFTAHDNDPLDAFGQSLSMTADGDTLIVGAPGWDGPELNTETGEDLNDGLVYAYDVSGAAPVLLGMFGEETDPRIPQFASHSAIAPDGSALAGAQFYATPFGQEVSLFGTDFLGWERLVGSAASETLRAGAGSQAIFGDGGDDVLRGRGGRDWLDGGEGDDRLNGGGKADMLIDGAGSDRIKGAAGRDIFRIEEDGARDVIRDFAPGEDLIDLSAFGLGFADLKLREVTAGLRVKVAEEVLLLRGVDAVVEEDFLF